MTTKLTLALIGLLAPRLAGATGVDVLDVYEKLTGKTLLIHNATPRLPESIVSDLPPETTNAIARMESDFSKNGIAIVHDGPNFVRIFPKDCSNLLTNLPLRGVDLRRLPSQKKFLAGSVNFSMAPLYRVLPIYAAIKRRTVLSPGNLPHTDIHLKNACPLNREEFVYAIETVLAFNGLGTAEDGQKFVQVVPMSQKPQITAHSPTPEPTANCWIQKNCPHWAIPPRKSPSRPWRPRLCDGKSKFTISSTSENYRIGRPNVYWSSTPVWSPRRLNRPKALIGCPFGLTLILR